MTKQAQNALRRIIEDFSDNTRFCLICNYITKIIEPLGSRCIKFQFKSIPIQFQLQKMKEIAISQNIVAQDNDLMKLIVNSKGDLRKSINQLQSCAAVLGLDIREGEMSQLISQIPLIYLQQILSYLTSKTTVIEIFNFTGQVCKKAYAMDKILENLLKMILASDELKDLNKAKICQCICETQKCLQEGSDNFIQLNNLFIKINTIARQ